MSPRQPEVRPEGLASLAAVLEASPNLFDSGARETLRALLALGRSAVARARSKVEIGGDPACPVCKGTGWLGDGTYSPCSCDPPRPDARPAEVVILETQLAEAWAREGDLEARLATKAALVSELAARIGDLEARLATAEGDRDAFLEGAEDREEALNLEIARARRAEAELADERTAHAATGRAHAAEIARADRLEAERRSEAEAREAHRREGEAVRALVDLWHPLPPPAVPRPLRFARVIRAARRPDPDPVLRHRGADLRVATAAKACLRFLCLEDAEPGRLFCSEHSADMRFEAAGRRAAGRRRPQPAAPPPPPERPERAPAPPGYVDRHLKAVAARLRSDARPSQCLACADLGALLSQEGGEYFVERCRACNPDGARYADPQKGGGDR